jgi:hypothetical protein
MPRNDTTLASSMINYSLSDCAKNFAQVSYWLYQKISYLVILCK